MNINFLITALAALIPLVVGFVYYHPKVFGNAWMKVNGFRMEDLQSKNMGLVFAFTLLLSFLLAIIVNVVVIHQFHVYSVLMNEPGLFEEGSEIKAYVDDFMSKYGKEFRTFKHGAFHGFFASILFALPVLGINALFEHRGWKYIWIHTGYWALTLALMGGIICGFS